MEKVISEKKTIRRVSVDLETGKSVLVVAVTGLNAAKRTISTEDRIVRLTPGQMEEISTLLNSYLV